MGVGTWYKRKLIFQCNLKLSFSSLTVLVVIGYLWPVLGFSRGAQECEVCEEKYVNSKLFTSFFFSKCLLEIKIWQFLWFHNGVVSYLCLIGWPTRCFITSVDTLGELWKNNKTAFERGGFALRKIGEAGVFSRVSYPRTVRWSDLTQECASTRISHRCANLTDENVN